MSSTMKEFRFFAVPEWEKEQEYLRQRHNEGWRLVKVNCLGCYHFEACRPQDVVYQLDYNQEGAAHKEEYVQMFCDCGWEYLQDFFGYSYFRKAAAEMTGDEEGIFCDDASRIDMMKRVFRGRLLPLVIILFCCILPQLISQSRLGNTPFVWVFAGLLALYGSMFVWFGIKYWQVLKRMK